MDEMEATITKGIEFLKSNKPPVVIYKYRARTHFSHYLTGIDGHGWPYEVLDTSRPEVHHSAQPVNLAAEQLSRAIEQQVGNLSKSVAVSKIF